MIQLLIVDEVQLTCDALAAALKTEPDIAVTATATAVEQALHALAAKACDLVLISSNLTNGGALTLIEAIKVDYPNTRSIIIGIIDTNALIVRYIEAGAIGYVLRHEPLTTLLEKIRAASDERALVTPEIAAVLIERVSALSDQLTDLGIDHGDYEKLTVREREILELVAEGLTNQEIADELIIAIGTVKNHVHNILDKLNVHSRQDAAIYLSLVERGNEL
ncbi:MAG TPA: response regulator transcription factor [Caldilineaceae bacterium]|nr:response regulator transcription factor [Caldilineaceae bacterium]